MIELTKLNHEKYHMNCDLIEIIEQMPDTLITMTTGKKYFALETPEEILSKIKKYKIEFQTNHTIVTKQKVKDNNEEETKEKAKKVKKNK